MSRATGYVKQESPSEDKSAGSEVSQALNEHGAICKFVLFVSLHESCRSNRCGWLHSVEGPGMFLVNKRGFLHKAQLSFVETLRWASGCLCACVCVCVCVNVLTCPLCVCVCVLYVTACALCSE